MIVTEKSHVFLVFYTHASRKVACHYVQGWGVMNAPAHSFVAHAANETAAFRLDVHICRNQQFHSTGEGVDVNFLIFGDKGLAQIESNASEKGVESRTMERFTFINVFVAAKSHGTTDALAILTLRNGPLQPLVGVAPVTADDEPHTDEE